MHVTVWPASRVKLMWSFFLVSHFFQVCFFGRVYRQTSGENFEACFSEKIVDLLFQIVNSSIRLYPALNRTN